MDFSNPFVIIFLVGTVLNFVLNQILEFVDFKYRKTNGKNIPDELKEHISEEVLDKTIQYENAKYFFWIPKNIFMLFVDLTLIFSGFYVLVFNWGWNLCENAYLCIFLFGILSGLPKSILSIPFDLFREFKLEKKFGFSTMTFKIWILDVLKGILIEMFTSLPLLALIVCIFIHMNAYWWILVSVVVVLFSLGIAYIYPTFIAPIFNKFIPVKDENLKQRLETLLEKTGFKSKGIFQMDASKRSKHSNAYFTGFGKNKRIVLYDTLIEQLNVDEMEAVLGHELGHYKKKHITKKLIFSIPMIFVVAFVMNFLVKYSVLYTGFGFDEKLLEGSKHSVAAIQFIGVFLIQLIFEGYSCFVSLISNFFSRKDEFEADKFSAELVGSSIPLTNALIKLNKENLSEIRVPKIYSMFNYNHPPLMERIEAIKDIQK